MKYLVIAGIVIILIFTLCFLNGIPSEASEYYDSLNPQDQPFQETISLPEFTNYLYKNVSFIPRAKYSIDARLLRKKKYSRGIEARTIPWDFALGWGIMSEQSNLNDLKLKQLLRFYLYSLKPGHPIPQTQIRDNSANCHLIPASKNLLKVLAKIRKGDLIRIEGYLVDISFEHKRPYVWKTSLVRTDEGAGACETIYVESIIWKGKKYN